MRTEFNMPYGFACHWWKRSDLEDVPVSIKRVTEILYQAVRKVYEINPCHLQMCEPSLLGVQEALTGRFRLPVHVSNGDYPPEELDRVSRILAEKGVPVIL